MLFPGQVRLDSLSLTVGKKREGEDDEENFSSSSVVKNSLRKKEGAWRRR